jgi:hypothetical protein
MKPYKKQERWSNKYSRDGPHPRQDQHHSRKHGGKSHKDAAAAKKEHFLPDNGEKFYAVPRDNGTADPKK